MVKNRDKTKKCHEKALLEKSMMSDISATNSSSSHDMTNQTDHSTKSKR